MKVNTAILKQRLQGEIGNWIPTRVCKKRATDTQLTERAIRQFDRVWGVTKLSVLFEELLKKRGLSIYDRTIEHHFTGSVIIVHPKTHEILMTLHPRSKKWQQLGGHDEGECNPLAVAAREAYEESGMDNLWIYDCPVRVDPHLAIGGCITVSSDKNWHYDICYMAVTNNKDFVKTKESLDMNWFSIKEIRGMVKQGRAQKRILEMAENSIILLNALESLGEFDLI